MKILALHLPQFHRIPENDKWWGEGYTEWTCVKKAKPIYKGHFQPVKPMNEYYYDLTDPDTIKWQAKLARKYGLSGFVFYHYWYSGKQMLEKPCEILLEHGEIEIEYCFCWANHPWTRAWDGKEHKILQEQTYGGEEDWKKHFDYLLNFFMDQRYIKISNKPVLFIYNAGAIPEYDKMIFFWDGLAKKSGYEGLYIVQFINSKNLNKVGKRVDAVFEDEPLYSARFEIPLIYKAERWFVRKIHKPDFLFYEYLWEKIINKKREYGNTPIVRGAFCSFDNSPRKGSKGPTIVRNSSPELFGKYMSLLFRTYRKKQSEELIVINAWNEWGETAMLEPSDKYGYAYLDALKRACEENNI